MSVDSFTPTGGTGGSSPFSLIGAFQLAALCDIFDVTPAELIPTEAVNLGVRKIAAGDRPATAPDIGELRPVRARIVRPGE